MLPGLGLAQTRLRRSLMLMGVAAKIRESNEPTSSRKGYHSGADKFAQRRPSLRDNAGPVAAKISIKDGNVTDRDIQGGPETGRRSAQYACGHRPLHGGSNLQELLTTEAKGRQPWLQAVSVRAATRGDSSGDCRRESSSAAGSAKCSSVMMDPHQCICGAPFSRPQICSVLEHCLSFLHRYRNGSP